MKRSIAIILTLILVLACLCALAACQNGADGNDGRDGVDGKDGINGTNGADGKDGTNGKDGVDGKTAYQLYKDSHPEYSGDEQQWLTDLANGKLASENYYEVVSYGKNFYATVSGGTATTDGTNMNLSNCIAQLNKPIILPTSENAYWQICVGGTLATKDSGVQLLNSSANSAVGRVYFAANAGQNKVYLGVNIGGVYINYCWNVPSATIKSQHTYVVKYENGVYALSIDEGRFQTFDSYNCDQSSTISQNVDDAKKISADFNSKVRAVFGQDFITFTALGATDFTVGSKLGYLSATTSAIYNYQNLACHPLYGKMIYHLGSSISYGHANNGVSFAEQIRDITGSTMNKQTVSGTTLSMQASNSYAQRFSNFTFSDNPQFLVLQLSTNDFTRSGITLGTVGTATEGFDTNTTAGAMEYIISETKKKSPNTQIVIYSSAVKDGWKNNHAEYSRFATIELNKLQSKWGITIVDLYGADKIFAEGMIMSDDIHPNKQGYASLFTPALINGMLDYLETK